MKPIFFHTKLSIEECERRLQENLDDSFLNRLFNRTTLTFFGKKNFPKFSIFAKQYSRSYPTVFRGELKVNPEGGTDVTGHFNIYPLLAFLSPFLVLFIFFIIQGGSLYSKFLFILVCIVLPSYQIYLTRSRIKKLVPILFDLLDAER